MVSLVLSVALPFAQPAEAVLDVAAAPEEPAAARASPELLFAVSERDGRPIRETSSEILRSPFLVADCAWPRKLSGLGARASRPLVMSRGVM